MNERASVIKIGGKEYELLLTTRATKEISKKFGGLGKMGEKLEQSESAEDNLADASWIICLLANQAILRHNFENPNDTKPLLTEEYIELYTLPGDFEEFGAAITNAIYNGTRRDVPTGEEKN